MTRVRPILIAGPTASGKSALALALAERLGGTVVNADSMQVYREIPILAARPTAADEARAPHRLYGHVPSTEAYSAGRFIREVSALLPAIQAAGSFPIIVGGTGLYFKALLEGLSPIPSVPDDIRAHWRREGERLGPDALHAVLAKRDPAMATRLERGDRQRIVRALEVLDATGRSLADWQNQPGSPVVPAGGCVGIVLSPPRDWLHERSAARFDAMMAMGALAEAEAAEAMALDGDLPAARALGMRPLRAHVRREIELEMAVTRAKAETRQYIKRQETWLRRHMMSWKRLSAQEKERNADQVITFMNSTP
ncbi:MAG: tRNA (adenosine(37)-N6)-dimethylallyltransferase MiaA [Hyphomicrobium sp.]|nr:tRNA (adenosine(37)-N6)-dimethylallyltransferase MiaA [Hyphomicrobium sp.]